MGPVVAGIWPEMRWPVAAPWAAVSDDVGATKTSRTGSTRQGGRHGGDGLVRRWTNMANWSGEGRRRHCQPVPHPPLDPVCLKRHPNHDPSSDPHRPDPHSRTKVSRTGIATTICVLCDCEDHNERLYFSSIHTRLVTVEILCYDASANLLIWHDYYRERKGLVPCM